MRRIMVAIVALAWLITTVGRADGHVCTAPVEVAVGEPVTVTVGIAAEETPVVEVEMEVPDGFRYRELAPGSGWQAAVEGDVVRLTGGRVERYQCGFVGVRGEALRRDRLVMPVTTVGEDGTRTEYEQPGPGVFPAQLIYAGIPVPSGEGGSAGASPAAVLGGILIGVGVVGMLAFGAWRAGLLNLRRGGGAAAAVMIALLVTAAPAGAHAELRSTEPAAGAVLDRSPERIVLRFTEPVEVSLGGIRVYNAEAERLDRGAPARLPGERAAVVLDLPELDDGGYVVTWRVVSADSHPVQGAFTFRVGDSAPGDEQGLARELLAGEGGSQTVGTLYAIARFLAFAGLVVLVGSVTFLVALWPEGGRHGPVRGVVWGALVAAGVGAAATVGLQGAYAAALPLGDAADPSVWRSVLETRFGRVQLARLALLALSIPVVVLAVRGRRSPVITAAGIVLGLALLLTPGLAGHAAAGDHVELATAANLVHLGGVALWLGGIAVLLAALVPRGSEEELDAVVPRFSRAGLVAVAIILASGLVQAWRQVGSLDALTTTTYGRLLAVKIALFAAMVALAAGSRSWVRRRYGSPAAAGPGAAAIGLSTRSRLRRWVGGEAAAAAAVLAVTALLVNAVPARTALAQPYSTGLAAEDVLVDLTVDPAKAGPVDVHLYTLAPDGAVLEVADLRAQLALPEEDIGPLALPLQRAGPGHFVAYGFDVPIPGAWQLEVTVVTSELEQRPLRATVPVR